MCSDKEEHKRGFRVDRKEGYCYTHVRFDRAGQWRVRREENVLIGGVHYVSL